MPNKRVPKISIKQDKLAIESLMRNIQEAKKLGLRTTEETLKNELMKYGTNYMKEVLKDDSNVV